MEHTDSRSRSTRDWDKLTADDIRNIASRLHPNVVVNSLKPLNSYTAAALSGAYTDVRLHKEHSAGRHTLSLAADPWPGDAFVAHWSHREPWRSLSHPRKLQLLCLAASSFHAASLQAAIAASGEGLSAEVVEAAAAAGDLAACRLLLNAGCDTSFRAVALAAAFGQLHVLQWIWWDQDPALQLRRAFRWGAQALAADSPWDADLHDMDAAVHACAGGQGHVLTWLEQGLPPPPPPPGARGSREDQGQGQQQQLQQKAQLGEEGYAAAALEDADVASVSPTADAYPLPRLFAMAGAAARGGHTAVLDRLIDRRGLYVRSLFQRDDDPSAAGVWHHVLGSVAQGRCAAEALRRYCGDDRIPWRVDAADGVHEAWVGTRSIASLLAKAVSSERDWRAKAAFVMRLLLLKLRGLALPGAEQLPGGGGEALAEANTNEQLLQQLNEAEAAAVERVLVHAGEQFAWYCTEAAARFPDFPGRWRHLAPPAANAWPLQWKARMVQAAAYVGNVDALREELESMPPEELDFCLHELASAWNVQSAAGCHASVLRLLWERLVPAVPRSEHVLLAAHSSRLPDVQALIEAVGVREPQPAGAPAEAEWEEDEDETDTQESDWDEDEEGTETEEMEWEEEEEETETEAMDVGMAGARQEGEECEEGEESEEEDDEEDDDEEWNGREDDGSGMDEGEDESAAVAAEWEEDGEAAGECGHGGGPGVWSGVFSVLAKRGADLRLLQHLHERRGAAIDLAAVVEGGCLECCEWALAALIQQQGQQPAQPQERPPAPRIRRSSWYLDLLCRGKLAAAAWALDRGLLTPPAALTIGGALPHPTSLQARRHWAGGRGPVRLILNGMPQVVNCARLWRYCRGPAGLEEEDTETEASALAMASAAAAEGGGRWARLIGGVQASPQAPLLPAHQLAWLERERLAAEERERLAALGLGLARLGV